VHAHHVRVEQPRVKASLIPSGKYPASLTTTSGAPDSAASVSAAARYNVP
jgi:hypothetical protein